MFRRILYPNRYCSDAYIDYLKNKGVDIGIGCIVYSPNHTDIDVQRPHTLHIGNYVKITAGVRIIAHDYSRSVLCNIPQYGNVGESAITHIGDNVFIGINSIILMGSHIGNNCIVGAGTVVSGCFPDNTVIAGNPAKVICTIDEFYNKRKQNEIDSAKEYVRCWRKRFNREPSIYEMSNAFSWLYLQRTQSTIEQYNKLFELRGVDVEQYKQMFLTSEPVYKSFEEFLEDCDDE